MVDVLPQYLSSVYLFWDPDLPHLALGKLSALWEILWVQQAAALCPRLQYYCMGRALPPLTCRGCRHQAALRQRHVRTWQVLLLCIACTSASSSSSSSSRSAEQMLADTRQGHALKHTLRPWP